MSGKIVLAFDLYGTLLSTASIATKLAELYPSVNAAAVAQTWRMYQLEYTWRANSMEQYIPFDEVTQDSLKHALREYGVVAQELAKSEKLEAMLEAYNSLEAFADVEKVLQACRTEGRIHAVIFSNGTSDMAGKAVAQSPVLSLYRNVLSDIVTVDSVGRFKPHPAVYRHLANRMGKDPDQNGMQDMWLVSGNPFDVVGASVVGMRTIWVDRSGSGWTDKLGGDIRWKPDVIVRDLGDVMTRVKALHGWL